MGMWVVVVLSLVISCVVGQVSQYNVVWNTTSNDSRGSMPIGNGDIGLNVWAQSDALYFYIGKTDSWDQYNRLLKVGKVKVTLNPNPFASGKFQQILVLESGAIQISAEDISIDFWVDANNPVIYVDITSTDQSTFSAQAEIIIWRTTLRPLTGGEEDGAHGSCTTPYDTPDTVVDSPSNPQQVIWYHRNTGSATSWVESLEMQGLGNFASTAQDPLYNRTFGGILSATNMKRINNTAIGGQGENKYNISVVIQTLITSTPDQWVNNITALASSLNLGDPVAHYKYKTLHESWWINLWAQSFVILNDSNYQLGQWYNLQRWQDACGGGRGVYPIKFNGLIFVTDYYNSSNMLKYNADYRSWGGGYWFQNTRFPYWTMLANGDFDWMVPLFKMYLDAIPLVEARSQVWFNHPGGFFSETLSFWGPFLSGDYGCGYNKIPIWYVSSPWMRYHINGGLEVLSLLLAHYQYTADQTTAETYLLPLAQSIMNYFTYHYQPDLNGHQCFTPAQSIETWQEAMNPLPDVAGLYWTLEQLVDLPFITPSQKSSWNHLLSILPKIPTGSNGTADVLLPAQSWLSDSQHNVENPELYAIWPFQIYGVTMPDLSVGINSYWNRRFVCQRGWCQDVLIAALLGLTDEAKAGLAQRLSYPLTQGYRFPTFMGPFFDFQPEEDHTSVAQLATQYMLLQTRGTSILLFPSWPSGWDVHFKLYAGEQTTVEVMCVNNKITLLNVIPESRKNDIKFMGNCTL